MPIIQPLPEPVIENVVHLLQAHQNYQKNEGWQLWFDKQLATACRHIEYFVRPLVSIKAAKAWEVAGGQGCLQERRYKAPAHWRKGEGLHFEHAVPVKDLKAALLDRNFVISMDSVRQVLERAEIVWITKGENGELPQKAARPDWRAVYEESGIELHDDGCCPC